MNNVHLVLVDLNENLVGAWRQMFRHAPDIDIVHGSIFDQDVDAIVCPTNARGYMNGGLDAQVKHHLGARIESRLQEHIAGHYEGIMPVGHAACLTTGEAQPAYLISTVTMFNDAEDISDTRNPLLACAAAFQAVHMQRLEAPDCILSVAITGLGTGTGNVAPGVCAEMMWTAYDLFSHSGFASFEDVANALSDRFGALN